MKNILRHGELMLKQVDKEPSDGSWRQEKDYIVAHSETGHHHMVLGMSWVFSHQGKDLLLKTEGESTLKHQKDFDAHRDLLVPPGVYKIVKKTEYDPFLKTIKQIWD